MESLSFDALFLWTDKFAIGITDNVRGFEEMSSGEASENSVVADCRKAHGGNAAAL